MQATTVGTAQVDRDWKQWGEEIVQCLDTRDFEKLADRFHPQVRCRLLIPGGLMTPLGARGLIRYFEQWFGEADHFNVEDSQMTRVGDRLHVGYRLRLREGGVWYLVEQQTYSLLEEGSIVQFDLLCSGFRIGSEAS